MYCILEITKYPLTQDYEAPIRDFFNRLKAHAGLDVTMGEMSTVVRGDYDLVMSVVQDEMKTSMQTNARTAFVLKILSTQGS